MLVREEGDGAGVPVLYFHGTASVPDAGPDADLAAAMGIRVFRVDRPGYRATRPAHAGSLVDIAEMAVEAVRARGVTSLVAVGWSGGGPYALAAAVAAPSTVIGVGLVASWAPMEPPHPRLPRTVRVVMRLARVLPRPLLRAALAGVGRTTVGQVDDIRRVARPWGFSIDRAAQVAAVRAWHADDDREVPIDPWRTEAVSLRSREGAEHEPSNEVWAEIFDWVTTLAS